MAESPHTKGGRCRVPGCTVCGSPRQEHARQAQEDRITARLAAMRTRDLPRDYRALRVVERATGWRWGTWHTDEGLAWQRRTGINLHRLWTARMVRLMERARTRGERVVSAHRPFAHGRPRGRAAERAAA